jgi:hypothetical protein
MVSHLNGWLTPDGSSRLDLVVGISAMFAAKGHHDDFAKERD